MLPFDSLHRAWLELGPVNPDFVDQLRPTLVTFFASDKTKNTKILGSGAIIGADGNKFALCLTARHVALEYAVSIQKPNTDVHGSLFREDRPKNHLSIEPYRMITMWASSTDARMLRVAHTSFNDYSDLQAAILSVQESDTVPFHPANFVLDVRPVSVGEVLYQASYADLAIDSIQPIEVQVSDAAYWNIHRRVSIRCGIVTGVYMDGLRMSKWPVFTTSIPSAPGMSGGAIFRMKEGEPAGLCGIISADFSTEESRANFYVPGETVGAMVWPALALKMPRTIYPGGRDVEYSYLIEAMRTGAAPMPLGDLNGFDVTEIDGGSLNMRVPI